MRTSWKLIHKESSKDRQNQGIHTLNINGRSTTNHQIIANAFNEHFETMPTTITRNIRASNCSTKTPVNNQNNISFSLKNVFQTSFPRIMYHCISTKEIENIADANSKFLRNTGTQTTCYPNLHHIMFIHQCENLK